MSEPKDIEALRAQLDGTRGKEYWRSLEQLSGTPEFKDFLHREFPQNASEWLDPVGRRGFLKLMSASLALAGVSACTRQPNEELVPRREFAATDLHAGDRLEIEYRQRFGGRCNQVVVSRCRGTLCRRM